MCLARRQTPVFEWHATLAATSYPGVAEGDPNPILWLRWDELRVDCVRRRLLFLGYSMGLRIYCSISGSVSEILNLFGPDWAHVGSTGVLPIVPPSEVDRFVLQRP